MIKALKDADLAMVVGGRGNQNNNPGCPLVSFVRKFWGGSSTGPSDAQKTLNQALIPQLRIKKATATHSYPREGVKSFSMCFCI